MQNPLFKSVSPVVPFPMPCSCRLQNHRRTSTKTPLRNEREHRREGGRSPGSSSGSFQSPLPCCFCLFSWSRVQYVQQLRISSLWTAQGERGVPERRWGWFTCRPRPLRPGRSWPVERRWRRLRPSAPVVLPAASEATPAEPTPPAAVGPLQKAPAVV